MIDILPRPDIKGKTLDEQATELNEFLIRYTDVLESILEAMELDFNKKVESINGTQTLKNKG